MKKVICLTLAMVFLFTCTVVAFADVELLPSGVVSWSDVGEDALNLANTYLNTLKSKSGKEFFKNASDIPTSWLQTMSDGSWALSPVDDYYYFLKDGILQVGNKSGGGVGQYVDAPEDFYIPSDTLVGYIEEQNTFINPKGKDLFIQSFRSDSRWRSIERVSKGSSLMYNPFIPLFDDTDKTQFKDLWFVPFYQDENSVLYYSDYQFHLYYVPNDDQVSDIALKLDLYRFTPEFGNLLQSPYSGIVDEYTSATVPLSIVFTTYLSDSSYNGFSKIYALLSVDDYLNGKNLDTIPFKGYLSEEYLPKEIFLYKSSDGSKTLNIYKGADGFPEDKFERNSKTTTAAPNEDIGFICSHSLIERTYTDIDTSKIPSNQVINITGDTIYDYSITNPDTGASSTINEYVTNNYYYPEVPGTSESSGGGGVGGNVNVGGNISVGGQVGVDITVSVPDININVNQGSGAGESGTVINPDDILEGSSVDLDKYYDDAVSQASGVRAFLEEFFDFLPAEIIGLLGLLIAVAIVCRIFGR